MQMLLNQKHDMHFYVLSKSANLANLLLDPIPLSSQHAEYYDLYTVENYTDRLINFLPHVFFYLLSQLLQGWHYKSSKLSAKLVT